VEVEALAEQLTAAVADLTSFEAWLGMLRVAARFTRYSPTNVLLLWMQAEHRGITRSRVAGYRAWQAMGLQVVKGARSLAVRAPVRRRLTMEEAAERARTGQWPAFDADGRPAMVVRGFRLERVFRYEDTAGEPLPEAPDVGYVTGNTPEGAARSPPSAPRSPPSRQSAYLASPTSSNPSPLSHPGRRFRFDPLRRLLQVKAATQAGLYPAAQLGADRGVGRFQAIECAVDRFGHGDPSAFGVVGEVPHSSG
jgi:N-terminal domain of anti-restriction factor ArdC